MPAKLPISPQKIDSQCLCLALKRAARVVSRRYDVALESLQLNNGQYSMLVTIAGHQSITIQTLADSLAMDRTTVTAGLKPLQRRELVEVAVSEDDPRARVVVLTRQGNALLTKAMPLWRSAQQEAERDVSHGSAVQLRRLLASIR